MPVLMLELTCDVLEWRRRNRMRNLDQKSDRKLNLRIDMSKLGRVLAVKDFCVFGCVGVNVFYLFVK